MVDAAIRGNLWNMLILFPNWRMACALRVRAWAAEIRRCPRCEKPPNIWQKSLPQAKIKSGVKIHLTFSAKITATGKRTTTTRAPSFLGSAGHPEPNSQSCLPVVVPQLCWRDSFLWLTGRIIEELLWSNHWCHDTWKWFFLIDLIVFKDLINVRDWTDAA